MYSLRLIYRGRAFCSSASSAANSKVVLEAMTCPGAFSPAGHVSASRASRSKFVPQLMRFSEFTEERARFSIPLSSRYERVRAIEAIGGDVCALATQPFGIHVVDTAAWEYSHIDLDRIVPFMPARPLLSKLRDQILVFLPTSSDVIRFSPRGGPCSVLRLPKAEAASSDSFFGSSWNALRSNTTGEAFIESSEDGDTVVFGKQGEGAFTVMRYHGGDNVTTSLVELPEEARLQSIDILSPYVFAVKSEEGSVSWVVNSDGAEEDPSPGPGNVYTLHAIDRTLHDESVDSLDSRMQSPGLYEHGRAYYQELLDATESGVNEIVTSLRDHGDARESSSLSIALRHNERGIFVVREEDLVSSIEVVHPDDSKSRSIDVKSMGIDAYKWIDAAQLQNGEVCTLQVCDEEPRGAIVRMWQVDEESLREAMGSWRQMMGWREQSTGGLRMTGGLGASSDLASSNPPKIESPKHGKEDPNNDPHVGGNTWAGGTGGSNTAGLGGRGGPYRLDKGHPVHQVSDAAKAEVDEATKAKARAIAEQAFKERMREIDMSEDEENFYTKMHARVADEIEQLRVVLGALEARAKERVWLRNQSDGDFDDAKLVDGMTGERLVYKRRGMEEKAPGAPQGAPKAGNVCRRLLWIHASFNGQDGRMERESSNFAL